ncbi:XapX domain-containing protein [Escherichia coli]|nr:XapX domain-containing protein [Escherichia coli]MBC0880005.1 XapX domain-containing protein [Escherichia coli]
MILIKIIRGFISALFTIVRLPIPVPNVLPGILSIVFMYVGYLVVKYFMP